MSVRLLHLRGDEADPYTGSLRELERDIRYPLGDSDAFTIEHGERYSAFFSELGESHFLVAVDEGHAVGGIAAALKTVRFGDDEVRAAYLGDFKLAPPYRGGAVARRILLRALIEWPLTASARSVRLVYGAAMRGTRGDVTRSARRGSLLKLARAIARLEVYFVQPSALAALDLSSEPPGPAAACLDLSPSPAHDAPGIHSTLGRKDLRLASTGEPWPLVHLPLGPQAWVPSWGAYLKRCAEAMLSAGLEGPTCFAVDTRRREQVEWLKGQGVVPDAACTVYVLPWFAGRRRPDWVHLATSEI